MCVHTYKEGFRANDIVAACKLEYFMPNDLNCEVWLTLVPVILQKVLTPVLKSNPPDLEKYEMDFGSLAHPLHNAVTKARNPSQSGGSAIRL